MTRLITKIFAAITLSIALLGATFGPAQAAPTLAAPVAGSGSGGSGSSLTPLFTFPLGALYVLLCQAEPTTSPLCALIYQIGSGSVEPDPS